MDVGARPTLDAEVGDEARHRATRDPLALFERLLARRNHDAPHGQRRYRAHMHVVGFEVEVRIPASQSLKDRRQVVRSLLDGARQRFHVSAAEVGGQDTWQRATLGFAVVASEARLAESTVDEIDRFLWSRPEIEVVDAATHWLD